MTRQERMQHKANAEATRLLQTIWPLGAKGPSPKEIELVASYLMVFGTEYAVEAFAEYCEQKRVVLQGVR